LTYFKVGLFFINISKIALILHPPYLISPPLGRGRGGFFPPQSPGFVLTDTSGDIPLPQSDVSLILVRHPMAALSLFSMF
jgi:hypothetical protein